MLSLDQSNFETEVLQSQKPVVVDFWAQWCSPCRALAPMLEEFATEFSDTIKVGKVDVQTTPELAQQFGIGGIPTLLIFKEGKVVGKTVGIITKQGLAESVQPFL